MGNLLQYTDKSETIDNKLSSLLNKINYDYQNGIIRTETEYYYRIKNMLAEFYSSLTKPTFQYRPAVSTPVSDDYNVMITESCSDIEYIIKDCEALNLFISQSFTNAELQRTMLTNELNYLSREIKTIGDSVTRNQPKGTVVFTELFNDLTIVGNLQSNNACRINTTDGILTLQPSKSSYNTIHKLEIDNEVSNGFPGNTHCVDTLNHEMHFIGQEGLHNNPLAMIDRVVDTWFEYELFSITDEVRSACNSYGFEYEEGISWINNKDLLRLKIVLTISTEVPCSWISIIPYIPDKKGVKSCFLEKCLVITASHDVYEVATNKAFDEVLVFPFPPQTVQRIELTFVQPSKYLTKIGHFYYTMADTTSMSIFQQYDDSDIYARTDGKNPSIGLLNLKYNPITKWVSYPDSDTEMLQQEYVIDKLFSLPESTIEKKSCQEIIESYRSMIGIRNIRVTSCTFYEYGEYISHVFTTEEPITSIVLEAEEYIPRENPEILRYFISLNGGVTWHKIYPIHRSYSGIYKYYVNNDSIENLLSNKTKEKRAKNLTIAGEAKIIQIKIEMDCPYTIQDDKRIYDTYSSPIVYGYKLRLTIGGETIEY